MRKRKTAGQKLVNRYDLWIDRDAMSQLARDIDKAIRKEAYKAWDAGYAYFGSSPGIDNPYSKKTQKKEAGDE
jgi:hypothetical protein